MRLQAAQMPEDVLLKSTSAIIEEQFHNKITINIYSSKILLQTLILIFTKNHHFMKRTLLFLSLIFIACNTDSNKENAKSYPINSDKFKMPTGLEEHNLKGKVKKVTEYHYTAQIKNGQYIKSENIFYTVSATFNENGEPTEKELADYKGKNIVRTQKYLCNIINDSTKTQTMYLNGRRTNKHILTWRNKYTEIDSLFVFLTPEDSAGNIKIVTMDEYDPQYRNVKNTTLLSDDTPNDGFYISTVKKYTYKGDTIITVYDNDTTKQELTFKKVITKDSRGNKTQEVSTTVGSDYHYVTEYKYEYYQ